MILLSRASWRNDSLFLKRPDGSKVNARIGGFLKVGYNRTFQSVTHWVTYDSCIAVPDLGRDEVPPGTEVWSVDPPQIWRATHADVVVNFTPQQMREGSEGADR